MKRLLAAGAIRGRVLLHLLCFLLALGFLSERARAEQVTLAGFAFAGQVAEAPGRFPHAFKVVGRASAGDATGAAAMSRIVVGRSRAVSNAAFRLNIDSLANLRDADQALVAALVLTGETVFVEDFGSYHKVFVGLRGEALIFDHKAQVVVRSYPISAVVFDAMPAAPAPAQIEAHVARLLANEGDASLVGQFVRVLGSATLPAPGTKTVQVRSADISDAALALFPQALRDSGVARSLLVDAFESSLSAGTGVPLIPSRVTHASGVMHVRFEDMYQYELKIPEGDYAFGLRLKRLAKIRHAANNVGTSYIFGAFVDIEFTEPLLGQSFLSAELKNGETAVVPAGRQAADDFPGYEDAIRGLFRKFAEAIQRTDSKWIRSASAAPDIEAQIRRIREIIESSRL